MEINPETAELKNMVQNLSNLVVRVSKDVNQMRGELNQINERLGSLEGRMATLEQRMSALETRLERRITDVFQVDGRHNGAGLDQHHYPHYHSIYQGIKREIAPQPQVLIPQREENHLSWKSTRKQPN